MQFSESWLRSFCNPALDTQGLAKVLTMSGLEVEELDPVAKPCSGIVVAEILEAVQHPNADRLRVCKVNAGAHSPQGPLQIVCGAPNARAGIRVPLATVGAVLPPGEDGKPFEIKVGKLRGVESFGMLCSADELGLGGAHDGLLELPADSPLGADIRTVLDLDDHIFTLKLTPNLAHNLSVHGIAREVAALTDSSLQTLPIEAVKPTHQEVLPVKVLSTDLCGRFSGRIIKNVNTKAETPEWMVRRLERSGQRPVSVLVDISNYVMFELGRPNHIFDLDKIHGGLEVRWAKQGETLELLNGKTVELDQNVGVVADHQAVESLAGIMGGNRTAVSDSTRNIYVEAAFWYPDAVAGRSRRFNFSTEAGHRFERGVDPERTAEHIERITRLILDICGGEPGPMDDQQPNMPQHTPVAVRVARASKVIGMDVSQADCAAVFTRLGLSFTEAPGVITVNPPSWRFDLSIEEDLIEEIIRVIGYHRLPATPPLAPIQVALKPETRRTGHTLRRAVASLGYQETINFSFVEEKAERELAGNSNPIRLLNPIAAPLAVMRSSLLGSLMGVLKHNLARKASRVRVFELGRVFMRDSSVQASLKTLAGINQPLKLAGLAYGSPVELQWGSPERPVDFYDVKGDVEALLGPGALRFVAATHPAMHPGRCAAIEHQGRIVGHVGELHPKHRQAWDLPQAPVLFELDAAFALERPFPAYQPIAKFQPVQRDLALVADSKLDAQTLLDAMKSSDSTGVLRSAVLFDVYKPGKAQGDMAAHERSLAIRLELLDPKEALVEESINTLVAQALAAATALGARLRA